MAELLNNNDFGFFDLKELPRKYKKINMDRTFTKLVNCKVDFYVRRGSECNELIYDKQHRIFANQVRNFPNEMIYLFNTVQIDVKKFLKNNPFIQLPPKVNVQEYNYDYDENIGVITGTDLDHAFWRIAYTKGYISNKTYNRGLSEKAKALRLATLSVLGREKKYDYHVGGVFRKTVILKKRDPQLQNVFKDIRFSCYYMMYELSKMLGDDFESWKTDCIYYRDTPENRTMVHEYFEAREMLFKQLVYNTMDDFSEVK